MMKTICKLLLFLGLLISPEGFGQCPEGNVLLNTQAQVNAYSGCSVISGNLLIGNDIGDPIVDLSPLINIEYIEGNLTISGNPDLSNLEGLNNLETIGGNLYVNVCSSMLALSGLENLKSIEGNFTVTNNSQLSDFIALENLEEIEGGIYIENNHQLPSLVGLQNVDPEKISELTIRNNSTLSVCYLQNICEYLGYDNVLFPRTIENNLSNCFAEASAMASCSTFSCSTSLGNLTFTSQAQVNAFGISYAHCNSLTAQNITIGFGVAPTTDITDLSPLKNIVEITGNLTIWGNQSLQNLDGLEKLTTIGGDLSIRSNQLQLQNIDGLIGLTSIGNKLRIDLNPNLLNLDGLDNLEQVDEIEITSNMRLQRIGLDKIEIADNILLKGNLGAVDGLPRALGGLTSLESVGRLVIEGEGAVNLNELSNLTNVGRSLILINMTYLSNIDALSGLTSIGGGLGLHSLPQLTNINGLSNIESIGAIPQSPGENHLELSSLPLVTTLSPLSNLTYIGEHLSISGMRDLQNLTGLEGLTEINSFLTISGNFGLQNLNGLSNITSIGGSLTILQNGSLQNIDALSSVLSVSGAVTININNQLQNLNGLSGLTIIGPHIINEAHLTIRQNNSLQNINGLSSLTEVHGRIYIDQNPALQNLNGLSGVTKIKFSLWIAGNSVLSDITGLQHIDFSDYSGHGAATLQIAANPNVSVCSLPNICIYFARGNQGSISNNAPGCNSVAEIIANCPDCPLGDVVLSSQQELNDLFANYPFCTEIDGNLIIGSYDGVTNITDLSPLENIESVTGSLFIMNNPVLESLDGLEALEKVGGNLSIGGGNVLLSDISALSSLESIDGYLQVIYNPMLESLDGLQNIDPLTIGGIGLHIIGNGNLTFCDLPNICSYLDEDPGTHPREISGNAAGCASVAGIQAACLGDICPPPGNLSFNSQDALNQFLLDYPNCTEITGNVTIAAAPTVTDLSPLQNITSITGNLTINFCLNLSSLEPLENLQHIGGELYLGSLINLPNLNGLHNVTYVGRGLGITLNNSLTDLQGLEGITEINNDFIYIYQNNTLTSLNGIQNINMDTVTHLYIQNHPNLSSCYTLPNICEYLYNGGAATISGNTGDCLNRNAIQNACPTIWYGNHWNIGEPDQNRNARIEGDLITSNDLTTKNFTVNSGAFTLAPNTTLTVNGKITNNADAENFLVQSGANLIQKEYTANDNVGEITVQRESGEMIRLDYTFWSSPVIGQNLFGFSPNTINGVTNHIGSTGRIYIYDGSNGYVNPDPFTVEAVMEEGVGYLFRSPNNFHSSIPATYMGEFKGIPFNGSISVSTHPLSYTSVGNPYPSNIDTDDFILANPGIATLYFWNNATDSGNNYATCALGNCVASGSGTPEPNGIISAGQGFIVATFDNSVSFDNSMRVDNSAIFFKTDVLENNRIRLNLSGEDNNIHNQILISYMEGATNSIDHQIDGKLFSYEGSALYNIINEEKFVIQGRELPFVISDVVPLGFRAAQSGKFKISLIDFDGLFTEGGMVIYLKDKDLNLIQNLMESDYSFESNQGEFNERFEVVYGAESTMGTGDLTSNIIQIYKDNEKIIVDSQSKKILSVKIYDLQGRIVHTNESVNANRYEVRPVPKGVLVVKVETQNGEVVNKKVIH